MQITIHFRTKRRLLLQLIFIFATLITTQLKSINCNSFRRDFLHQTSDIETSEHLVFRQNEAAFAASAAAPSTMSNSPVKDSNHPKSATTLPVIQRQATAPSSRSRRSAAAAESPLAFQNPTISSSSLKGISEAEAAATSDEFVEAPERRHRLNPAENPQADHPVLLTARQFPSIGLKGSSKKLPAHQQSTTTTMITTTSVAAAATSPFQASANSFQQTDLTTDNTDGSSTQANGPSSSSVVAVASAARGPSGVVYKNVTAQNGHSVLLHCQVEPSSDVVVSWFRGTGELQLLTYDTNTIIPDDRFVVKSGIIKGDWVLQIKNLDKSQDAGLYQCQTNSEPPISQYYQLNIVEPQAQILGAPDMAVKLGSPINLTCVISQSTDQLQFVFWYRDERMINYDINEQRGKIVMSRLAPLMPANVLNSIKFQQQQQPDVITSNLQIYNSKLSDSGCYTCQPSGARPTSIYVHVLEGSNNKQLIMFQNDYDPSSAASSQQQTTMLSTNSAVSAQVLRLSRGRAYGLFAVALILTSWYHLVVQIQTGISLLLLATIGFFIGKLSDLSPVKDYHRRQNHDDHQEESPRHRAQSSSNSAEAFYSKSSSLAKLDDNHDALETSRGSKNQLSSSSQAKSPDGATSRDQMLLPASPASSSTGSSANTTDPLIRNANGAISLLRALHETNKKSPQGKSTDESANIKSWSVASPTASSSGSSTGYNSDQTRSSPLVVSIASRRADLSDSNDAKEDGEDALSVELIELVCEPSAMSLAMSKLIKGTKENCDQHQDEDNQDQEEPYYLAPLSVRSTTTSGSNN